MDMGGAWFAVVSFNIPTHAPTIKQPIQKSTAHACSCVSTYLCQTLERQVAKGRLREDGQKEVHHLRLKDVAQRNPR